MTKHLAIAITLLISFIVSWLFMTRLYAASAFYGYLIGTVMTMAVGLHVNEVKNDK